PQEFPVLLTLPYWFDAELVNQISDTCLQHIGIPYVTIQSPALMSLIGACDTIDGIVIHCDRRCLAVVPVVCAQHLYELQRVKLFEARVDDYVDKSTSSISADGFKVTDAKLKHFFQYLMSTWRTEHKDQQLVAMCRKPMDERSANDSEPNAFEIPIYQWCAVDGASPYYTPLDVLYYLNGIQLYLLLYTYILISNNKDLVKNIHSLPVVLTGPSAFLYKEFVSTFLTFGVPLSVEESKDNATTTPPLTPISWKYVFDDPHAYYQQSNDRKNWSGQILGIEKKKTNCRER
ncbi:hypothetical protein RFI_04553, partial [Reticulomyxa filosa]